jgi:phosphatidylserine/phosphatidylglycerophosphate/cardiolipin synthase-like enzyme
MLPNVHSCKLFLAALLLVAGCSTSPVRAPEQQAQASRPSIEVAFSPEAGAEALVLQVIASAQQSVRLAAYSFTSPAVVRALMDAKKRGVDVQVVVDDKGNYGRASAVALGLIAGVGIPARTVRTYAIHHDKFIVVDARTTQTGSFNYSQAAARSNSENVLVVWDNPQVAERYLAHWRSRWAQGVPTH